MCQQGRTKYFFSIFCILKLGNQGIEKATTSNTTSRQRYHEHLFNIILHQMICCGGIYASSHLFLETIL